MLSHVGPILGLYWARLGLCWAMLGPSWAHVGPMLGPMLAYVGPMLAHVEPSWDLCWGPDWAIYVETSPKPRKNRCFFYIAKMKILAVEGPETPQKTMFFLTPQAKYAVNYRGFSGSGVGPGWAGGGSAAGGQPL